MDSRYYLKCKIINKPGRLSVEYAIGKGSQLMPFADNSDRKEDWR